MAEWTGLEPATPGVTGRYSNQLNYHSAVVCAWGNALTNVTDIKWRSGRDSNPRPPVTGRYSNQLNYHSAENHTFTLLVLIVGGVDGTRTRDPRRDRPVF